MKTLGLIGLALAWEAGRVVSRPEAEALESWGRGDAWPAGALGGKVMLPL